MILSVSRRTDIPALYFREFCDDLRKGRFVVANPYNKKNKKTIKAGKEDVDCIVFWTRDPCRILENIRLLDGYFFYIMVTITGYGPQVEKNSPSAQKVLGTFKRLSTLLGKDRIIWRYDPILISDNIDPRSHEVMFRTLAQDLSGHTERCIISFLDVYKKKEKRLSKAHIRRPTDQEIIEICVKISSVAKQNGISVQTCSEAIDLSGLGIYKGPCIDKDLINRYRKIPLDISKDKNQRPDCLCVDSIDIGEYNTCNCGCIYCYACR